MALEESNHLSAGLLIGPHHLAQLFRVELAGKRGRVYQITKQHGELATFGVRGRRFGKWDSYMASSGKRCARLLYELRGVRRW
jgi:hypothetical protein